MRSEQSSIQAKRARWLRIGTLALTTFTPFFNAVASLLPKRAALITAKDDIKAAKSDLNAQIKAELIKRHVQQLQKELRQHRMQQITAIPRQKIQDLIEASEIRKRVKHVRRTLQTQNRQFQKKWQKQFQQQTNSTLWVALGCILGFALAGIISYQFLRHRLQQREEEEAALELAYTDLSSENSNGTNVVPPDAVFVGITSTKLYYPIETSVEQSLTKDGSPAEAIFFSSEQEAIKQGFQPAPFHLSIAPSHS